MVSEGMQDSTIQPELVAGDVAAREGHWAAAIESWDRAVHQSPELRPAASTRIGWFLSHQPAGRRARPPAASIHLVLLSLATAILATALVLLPENPGSTSSNVAAIGAWILIALSAGTAIVAARRTGSDDASSRATYDHRVAEARRVANNLNTHHVKSEAIDE